MATPPVGVGMEPYPGYRLTRLVGRGAIGEVWEAAAPRGKRVAVKFLSCDSRMAAVREVRALQSIRQLRHPNLITIHQIWADSGYVAVVMELAEGSLLDLLQLYLDESGGPIPGPHLCPMLAPAAAALDFLNARQHDLNGTRMAVRHCDVKPSNLLVLSGKVKLADFSLSVPSGSALSPSPRKGTPDYSAPELFQGWLSERTDQYALAVSYCLLRGGRLPFIDTPPTFDPHYTRPAPDLTMLSLKEAQVILRALDHTPQNRWPTCTDMMDQLGKAVKRPARS